MLARRTVTVAITREQDALRAALRQQLEREDATGRHDIRTPTVGHEAGDG